ncbi:MAG: lipid-transfer protein [Candidatus Dadabacteria bacterium]|nr:MAG: lipid-transfer protein [Candidatus Dadabacteria bacterium]
MRDIAIVSVARLPHVRCEPLLMDAEMMTGVLTECLEKANLQRQEVDFWCSGSTDYLSGLPFSFVHVLDAIGPWPPVYETHVEMDGAWALYEAWLKMQYEDLETAVIYCWGKESTPDDVRTVPTLQLDPYHVAPLGPDTVSIAALQARALLDSGRYTESDFAEVVVRARQHAASNEYAQLREPVTAEAVLNDKPIVDPLTRSMCCPVGDGCTAVLLASADAARDLCDKPVWIRGIEHRVEPHHLGLRDLTDSPSTRAAATAAHVHDGPIDFAEIYAPFAHQELILRDALGLPEDATINPSGGALCGHTLMVSGLERIGEAALRLQRGDGQRAVAHATSGPALQQNLVCVLEAE